MISKENIIFLWVTRYLKKLVEEIKNEEWRRELLYLQNNMEVEEDL